MSGRRRASDTDLEAVVQQLFDDFKEDEDEDGERWFEEKSLVRMCAEKGLNVPEAQVRTMFADVKSKKQSFLPFKRFKDALGKIAGGRRADK